MTQPRPAVLFLAWTRTSGRSREIAAALGGEACSIFPERLAAKRLFAARYAYSLVVTVRQLLRLRPRAVIVTNPPVFPALAVRAYAALTGAPYVLDSHPTSFGAKQHVVSQRLIRVHRWLARKARATMVTTGDWVDVLGSWGAEGIVVHEAPPLWEVPPMSGQAKGVVLFVGIFATDEPVDAVIEAARLRPDLEVHVTGDLRRCPPRSQRNLPDNVRLVGYLTGDDYPKAIAQADVVVALTTERTSIVRAGYEAVYSRRPLVVTDWPAAREVFPFAVHTPNDPSALAEAFDVALSDAQRDPGRLEEARNVQMLRWSAQIDALRIALSVESPAPADDTTAMSVPS